MIPMSIGSIWGGGLTDILLILRYNKGIRILLCFKTSKSILYSKYVRLVFYIKKQETQRKNFKIYPALKK